jgi:hypothetical protein
MPDHELAGSIDGTLRFLRLGFIPLFFDSFRLGASQLAPTQESAQATATAATTILFSVSSGFKRECK